LNLGFCSKEFCPKSLHLTGNTNSFFNSGLDLHKRGLGLLVKFASFLDGGNASIGGKEDADWVNF
jgi:hypothetical protein